MKKPRKPFKKVIIKSRKITELTDIPPTVAVKVYPPVYVEQKDPDKSIIPAEWERLPVIGDIRKEIKRYWNRKNKEYNNSQGWRV